jgi:glucosylceramidase
MMLLRLILLIAASLVVKCNSLSGSVLSVQTSRFGSKFLPLPPQNWGPFIASGKNVLVVDAVERRQTIHGFGSALTEAAAFNFAAMSDITRTTLIDLLWAPPPTGNGYTSGRLHLGSSDFALSTYSIDETVGDYSLIDFDDALTHDSHYVIPLARAAIAAAGSGVNALKLFFSPWSPPAWLKINGNMIDTTHPDGLIQTDAASATLAAYFVRFAKAMSKHGVPLWGLTMQNEPLMNMTGGKHFYEACAWTAESQGAFLNDYLGPALRVDNETANLVVLGYDWNKGSEMPSWAATLTSLGSKFLGGIAFHWYAWAGGLQLSQLAAIEAATPGTFLLATEACIIKKGIAINNDYHGTFVGKGAPPGNESVAYTYAAGELYALDLLANVRYNAAGWIDWNAILGDLFVSPSNTYIHTSFLLNDEI